MLRELIRKISDVVPIAFRSKRVLDRLPITELRRRKAKFGEEANVRVDSFDADRTTTFPLMRTIQFMLLAAFLVPILSDGGVRAQALPIAVPNATALTVADQNEALQTLMIASGEQAKLAGKVTYANFLGGPSILEAFRAHALDLAQVGDAPPIQAQARARRYRSSRRESHRNRITNSPSDRV
jgi:hypothetical protein